MPRPPPHSPAIFPVVRLLCLGLALATGPVQAQSEQPSSTLNRYPAPPLASDGIALSRPTVPGHLTLQAALRLNYANDPLVYQSEPGNSDTERFALIAHQLTAHLSMGLGLQDDYAVFVSLPIHLGLLGPDLPGQPQSNNAVAGDFRLGGRWVLSRGETATLAAQFAATMSTSPDSGEAPGVAGDTGTTIAADLLGRWDGGGFHVTLNLGVLLRKNKRIKNIDFGNDLTYGLAVTVPIVGPVDLTANVFGSTPIADPGFGATTPLETLLGIQLALPAQLSAQLAGGLGLMGGYGSPDFRVVASIGYASGSPPQHSPQTSSDEDEEAWATRTFDTVEDPNDEYESLNGGASQPTQASTANLEPELDEEALAALADDDGDGLENQRDSCPKLRGQSRDGGCPRYLRLDEPRGELTFLRPISFARRSSTLGRGSLRVLKELLEVLQTPDKPRIMLAVHADAKTAGRHPQELTEHRARTLETWFDAAGIPNTQLATYACGTRRPNPKRTERARGANERVEAFITRPLPESGMPSTLGCTKLKSEAAPEPAEPAEPIKPNPTKKIQPAATTSIPSNSTEDGDGDGLVGAADHCPTAPGTQPHRGCPQQVQVGTDQITLRAPLRFASNRAVIRGRSRPALAEVAAVMRANPRWHLAVEGHAAQPDRQARQLAIQRAQSVATWLRKAGIERVRLHAVGCGTAHRDHKGKKRDRIELHTSTGPDTPRSGCVNP